VVVYTVAVVRRAARQEERKGEGTRKKSTHAVEI